MTNDTNTNAAPAIWALDAFPDGGFYAEGNSALVGWFCFETDDRETLLATLAEIEIDLTDPAIFA